MRIDEIEQRMAEISETVNSGAEIDVDALTEEVRSLKAEKSAIEERNAKEAELRNSVAPAVINEIIEKKEERKMPEVIEVRNSNEYAAAYLGYLKTGDEKEVRSLLSTNASSGGQIPVPAFLEQEIKTAWEESALMGLCKHSYFKGDVKVGFELSASDAAIHNEGDNAGEEEVVTIGVVTIKAANIKKWITVSDEALEGTTVDTIGYLYREIAHKIVAYAESLMIGKITAAPSTADATHCSVPSITAATIAEDTVVSAVSMLSGQARNVRLIMNRQSYAAFMGVALRAKYAIDVFDGLKDRIVFTDALPAFSAATTGNVYAIVGDFGYGAQVNMPNGDGVTIKTDDLSLAEKDLVKIVGRQYVGMAVVACNAFCTVKK